MPGQEKAPGELKELVAEQVRQVDVAVPAALRGSQAAPAAALLPPELCSLCAFTGTSPGAKVGQAGSAPFPPLTVAP